jgi:hypothetical protein
MFNENLKIEVIKHVGSWADAYYCMRNTIKNVELLEEPDLIMKRRMAFAGHSPCKVVSYLLKCTILNKTQNHLVRHHAGVDWFVQTLRRDLTGVSDVNVHRLTPRHVTFVINLTAIMHIYKVRICKKSEYESQMFAKSLREVLCQFDYALNHDSLWVSPCTTCREGAFKDCHNHRLDDSFFL